MLNWNVTTEARDVKGNPNHQRLSGLLAAKPLRQGRGAVAVDNLNLYGLSRP